MSSPPLRVGPSGPIADPSNPPFGAEYLRFGTGSLARVDILTTPTTLVDLASMAPISNAGADASGQLYEVRAQFAVAFASSGGPHANNLAVSVLVTLDDTSTIEVAIPRPVPEYVQSGDDQYPDGYTAHVSALTEFLVPAARRVAGAQLLMQADSLNGAPYSPASPIASNRTLRLERLS